MLSFDSNTLPAFKTFEPLSCWSRMFIPSCMFCYCINCFGPASWKDCWTNSCWTSFPVEFFITSGEGQLSTISISSTCSFVSLLTLPESYTTLFKLMDWSLTFPSWSSIDSFLFPRSEYLPILNTFISFCRAEALFPSPMVLCVRFSNLALCSISVICFCNNAIF